eukprot:1156540-Pelagomonas_calceolata.AAC.5
MKSMSGVNNCCRLSSPFLFTTRPSQQVQNRTLIQCTLGQAYMQNHSGHPKCIEHFPHPINSYKVKAHSGIIGNEGAGAFACTAALTGILDTALPDARDPLCNLYWLSLKSLHGRKGDPRRSHTAPTHYLTNLKDNF